MKSGAEGQSPPWDAVGNLPGWIERIGVGTEHRGVAIRFSHVDDDEVGIIKGFTGWQRAAFDGPTHRLGARGVKPQRLVHEALQGVGFPPEYFERPGIVVVEFEAVMEGVNERSGS